MRPFVSLQAPACPLPLANVDTDQLIPARFMRRPRSEGYGPFLLYDLRRRADGELDPDFPVNAEAYTGAEILVARRNFGGIAQRVARVALAMNMEVLALPAFVLAGLILVAGYFLTLWITPAANRHLVALEFLFEVECRRRNADAL